MSWLLLLYNILAVIVALDAIASTLSAYYLFHLRQRFGWYIALAFTGVACEAGIAVITMGFSPTPQRLILWILIVRIAARVFKALTMVMLPLYLLGYINGDNPNHTKGKQ